MEVVGGEKSKKSDLENLGTNLEKWWAKE